MFLNFSQNQKMFTVLFVAIAVDSFCSSFCHQKKPNQPSYISLWNALLRIYLKITNARGQYYDSKERNLASKRRPNA